MERQLRHNAFVYESDGQYSERASSFLGDGLARDEAAVVTGTRDRLAIMREALGPLAERATFVDVGRVYTRPARAIAAYYRTLLAALEGAPSVRVVADVQFGPTRAEADEWAAYEAMTNHAYSHLPAWLICSYNANVLSDPVLESAWQTHPEVVTDDWHESVHFDDPGSVIRERLPIPTRLDALRTVSPGWDLADFRSVLAREMAAERVPEGKALGMLVAANEVASNAVRYGDGLEALRVGRAGGRFVCEIVDRGPGFDDPMAGYRAPRRGEAASGLWVSRQLAWRVENFRSTAGHTVRLWL
jgi:anti-sigma regulatory factor (Ser/Thr protein kinase)